METIIVRKTPWWIFLTAGIMLLITAVALFVWPFYSASWMLALLFGVTVVSAGIGTMSSSRATTPTRFLGFIAVIAGLLAIIFNEFTASILVGLFGATLITLSVLGLLIGISLGVASSPGVWAPAVLGILMGVVPLVWPQFALSVIAIVLGFFTLIWGITVVSLALRQRKSPSVIVTSDSYRSYLR